MATAAAPATPAPSRNLRRFVIVFDLSDFMDFPPDLLIVGRMTDALKTSDWHAVSRRCS
jgi:hypothetical protein